MPASLIANWKAEIDRFAPSLSFVIVHPSETPAGNREPLEQLARGSDLVITTYGMLTRAAVAAQRDWDLVILDEAQAIKNSGTRQSRSVKELNARRRIAMTGTPVENRLSDLWSLFDFLNPGLLGTAKAFGSLVKQMESNSVVSAAAGPGRAVHSPPAEDRQAGHRRSAGQDGVKAYCTLEPRAGGPVRTVGRDLAATLKEAEGIQRRGLVLAQLMRLKQICNHPAQLLGTGDYAPSKAASSSGWPRSARSWPSGRKRRWSSRSFARSPIRWRSFSRASSAGRAWCCTAARPSATAATGRELSARRRAAVLRALAQGRRDRLNLTAASSRDPLRSLVEPRRGKPGDRPGLPDWPKTECPGAQIRLPGNRRGADRRPDRRESRRSPATSSKAARCF